MTKKLTALLTALCTGVSMMLPVSAAIAPEYRIPKYEYTTRTDDNGEEYAVILSCPREGPYLSAKHAIPAMLGGYPVRGIGRSAFYMLDADSVYIPESVSFIEETAFLDSGVRVFEIGNPECEIGAYALGYMSLPTDWDGSVSDGSAEAVYEPHAEVALFGSEGSSAQAYAAENGMFFSSEDRCFPFLRVIKCGGDDYSEYSELMTAYWRPSLKMRPSALVLPTELGGLPVHSAGMYAFIAIDRTRDYDLYKSYGITVPESYQEIFDYTFDLCNSYYARSITILNREIRICGKQAIVAESNHTIYGFAGSTTEAYCAENALHFVPLGDVDSSGSVSIADAVLMQRWLLGFRDTTLPDWHAADLNGDGMLNTADLTLMRREIMTAQN